MRRLGSVVLGALLIGVLAGVIVGALSVHANEYLARDLRYLAFHTLVSSLNRFLYVAGMVGLASWAIFSGLRLAARKPLLVPAYLAAVAALAWWARGAEIDYALDLAWREMDGVQRAIVVAWGLVCFDLAAGKAWLAPIRARTRPRAVAATALALLAIPLALNAAAAVWQGRLEARLAGKPSFMIFVIDALRADHVGCYGYGRDTSPTIDSLAAEGVLFENAASNSNITRLTVPSIFTMLFPSTLGLAGSSTVMAPRTVTIAELMRNAGYRTLCYIPNPSMKKRLNFGQGFDVYDDKIFFVRKFRSWESQSVINERVTRWFRGNRGKPFFIYIHSCDVHAPYSPPAPYDTMFYERARGGAGGGGAAVVPVRAITDAEYERMHGYQRLPDDNNDLEYYKALYDGEVRYTSDKLRELIGEMRALGIADETMFFVSADHGEGFLEHGEWDHGHHAYDEVVRVPLIMSPAPGAAGSRSGGGAARDDGAAAAGRGRVIAAPVHTFDISATILDLAGIAPEPEFQAKSFLPLVRGEAETVWEYAFIDAEDARALRNARWKFIQDRASGEERLFDLEADSAETVNLAAADTLTAGELRRKMAALVKANELLAQGGFMEEKDLDAETIEQLKALGYIK